MESNNIRQALIYVKMCEGVELRVSGDMNWKSRIEG
jgi:hypothetical protein